MIPHTYSFDSQTKSTDLAAKIISATAPPQIALALNAVESHLQKHSPDQSRHFFSIAFPVLICKLFGFDDASIPSSPAAGSQRPSSGWIDVVSDPEVSGRLYNLLSPNGVLMSSIMSVDKMGIVKYVFPTERLPQWVQFMLSNERDCRVLEDLCPLFKGRIKEDSAKGSFQVHLNVLEYYLFWFAYYPVCKGSSENSALISVKKSSKFRIENWASSIPVFSAGGGGSTRRGGLEQKSGDQKLYIRLLQAYLRVFVPADDVNSYQPYRSSLLHYPTERDDSVLLGAEFLVSTLVQYWLVDNDFSPLPVNTRKSFGLSFSFRAVLGEVPPVAGLAEVVKLFVKYLNVCSITVTDGDAPVECSGSPRWRNGNSGDVGKLRNLTTMGLNTTSSPSAGSWNSWIQRPLYRFILRTFLFCPMGSSIKNVSEVVSLWISYIEPWKLNKEEFAIVNATENSPKDADLSIDMNYSSIWQGYVLSNYLYYTSLILHFIGFAHKFLHTDPEVILQLVSKVINVLTSSKEMLESIRNVDRVFRSRHTGSSKSTVLNSLYKFVTPIREQLQDWEDGLCESDVDGSFLHENWNKELRLFSDGEDGGQQLLRLFVLRAETEVQATSADSSSHQCLDFLKSQLRCLFGDQAAVFNSSEDSPMKPTTPPPQSRDDMFKPRKIGNCMLDNVKYRGDWMRRPISDDEVGWLAKLLIQVSCWMNESLGLNQAQQGGVVQENNPSTTTWSFAELNSNLCDRECVGPNETLKVIYCSLSVWIVWCRLTVVKLMIKHGVRVNLRMLASKKFVTLLILFAGFNMLKRWLRSVW